MEANFLDIMIYKNMELLYVTWRTSIRKISPRSHHINNCDSIDDIMEKHCIQFIMNLGNVE